ncbi:NUDIX hydrolase [Christiangramia antarctica]|uniref:NUDIX hydrolase n=2 Tax=Flavobacteriaceae TaxID=49546 RepID=A0ABW5XBS9_9FLAO
MNLGETTIDDWMITGDYVQKSETLREAAKRILKRYVILTQAYQEQFNAFGDPDRIKNEKDLLWMQKLDVNPRILSVGYISLLTANLFEINDENLEWFPIHQLPELGFDHTDIIKNAYEYLQKKVLIEPLIFELLPDKFTLNELQIAFEAILDIKMDNRNFRKKVLRKKYIVLLDEKRKGNSKKPAQLYIFSKDIYNKIVEKHQLFIF